MNTYTLESLDENEFPYCIQCKDNNTGLTGSFLYDRNKWLQGYGFYSVSPVFDNTENLFRFCSDANLKPVFIIVNKESKS